MALAGILTGALVLAVVVTPWQIDGDFIRSLPTSATDQEVVKAAEFVGDEATLDLLGAAAGAPRAKP